MPVHLVSYFPMRFLPLLLPAALWLLASCKADTQVVAPTTTKPNINTTWQLVWAEEFNYTGLPDSTKWGYEKGFIRNRELQYFTVRRKQNARVVNGVLIIEGHKERYPNPAYVPGADEWQRRREVAKYTSASLTTRGKAAWTYGRFEVRAKLPSGRGTWPAIWMLPVRTTYGDDYWPDNGEIDIMEHVGFAPDTVKATAQTAAYNHTKGTHYSTTFYLPTARTAFNVYALEWTPEEIRGYVNGQHYFTFKNERLTDPEADWRQWPFDQPFYLILNLAIGGSWGGAQGVDPSIWPQRLVIDYVRVYQRIEETGR